MFNIIFYHDKGIQLSNKLLGQLSPYDISRHKGKVKFTKTSYFRVCKFAFQIFLQEFIDPIMEQKYKAPNNERMRLGNSIDIKTLGTVSPIYLNGLNTQKQETLHLQIASVLN